MTGRILFRAARVLIVYLVTMAMTFFLAIRVLTLYLELEGIRFSEVTEMIGCSVDLIMMFLMEDRARTSLTVTKVLTQSLILMMVREIPSMPIAKLYSD